MHLKTYNKIPHWLDDWQITLLSYYQNLGNVDLNGITYKVFARRRPGGGVQIEIDRMPTGYIIIFCTDTSLTKQTIKDFIFNHIGEPFYTHEAYELP